MNKLYFGDNLDVLRDNIQPESVDLIYLDPPFNSAANYNVLFKENAGQPSEAQVEAFRDTWTWGDDAAAAYEDVMRASGDIALALVGLKSWIGTNAMMAYVAMMAARMLELRHVLKPTGSIYLHCDSTASHYLKIIMDAIFGHENFRNEIIWKRTGTHSDSRTWSRVSDSILFYTVGKNFTWNIPIEAHSEAYLSSKYRYEDADGRRYRLDNITSPNPRPNMMYEWKGFPYPHNGWRYSKETMARMDEEDRIWYPRHKDGTFDCSKRPQVKKFLEELSGGGVMGNVWTDIAPLNSQAKERLGYPTQKPLSLLERIITASSNEGDLILDPFCGCGTTVEAAERLKRKWIGIDVTHYAVTLIEGRLKANHRDIRFDVKGRPVDLASARDLARRDKHQFQWWAAWRLGSQTYREDKKGADRGIDGNIFFKNGPFGDGRIIVSVKGGENVGVQMVRDLRGVIEREEAELGILITLIDPTGPMVREASDAGFLSKSAHGRLPRLQIVTVENMLAGTGYKLPPLPVPEKKLTPAIKKRDANQLELLLPFAGEKVVPSKGTIVDPRFVQLAV